MELQVRGCVCVCMCMCVCVCVCVRIYTVFSVYTVYTVRVRYVRVCARIFGALLLEWLKSQNGGLLCVFVHVPVCLCD